MFANRAIKTESHDNVMAVPDCTPQLSRPGYDIMLVHEILQKRELSALFQPILDLRSGKIIGFEGLIRGPADSPLHSPINLFSAAEKSGLALEVEMLSRQVVLETFAQLNLPGSLFLNVSPETLTNPGFKNGQTLSFMDEIGLDPAQVIIEVTENQPTFDFVTMRNCLLHYRSMGFQIALDDLGEGFSSLRLWSELRPDFVKIDMHFVQGVDTDPIKLQFLKSIQKIAESSGTRVIAEGVETEAELMVVKDIGIALCQGYFIARPSRTPALNPIPEVSRVVGASHIAVFPKATLTGRSHATAQKLLSYVEPAQPDTTNETVFERFSADPGLRVIPVVRNGLPVGLINRYNFIDRFAKPYQRELFGKKPCIRAMQADPLLVSKDMPIEELSHFLADAEGRHFSDGFIVTEDGRYVGLASGQDLLRELTKMQIEAARYANPLTLLPGNVPVNEHIERLMHAATPFAICYADLDNFKPFNDVYSYRKGDEMIQLAGRILGLACDPRLDFIGHIGGDDFILLMQSTDWKKRCNDALQSFAQMSVSLAREDHRRMGGYESKDRSGKAIFHPLTTMSIGVVRIEPGQFESHYEVSAAATEAKKMAKQMPGNSLFCEVRRPSNGLTVPFLLGEA